MNLEDAINNLHGRNNNLGGVGQLGSIMDSIQGLGSWNDKLSSFGRSPLEDYFNTKNTLDSALGGLTHSYFQQQHKLSNLSDIASPLADRYNPFALDDFSSLTKSLEGSLSSKLLNTDSFFSQGGKNPFAVSELHQNSISSILSNQNSIFEKLNGFTNSFTGLASLQADILGKYSLANVNSLLRDTIVSQNWEDLQTFEQYTEDLNDLAESTVASGTINVATLRHFENAIAQINERLEGLTSQDDKKRVTNAILNYIAIIGFIIGLIAFYLQVKDCSNSESNDILIEEIRSSEKRIQENVNKKLSEINAQRTAFANVNLRYSPKKKSQKLGLVKMGQTVSVLTINHKWLLISYFDRERGMQVTGWVMKKYFEKK